MARLAGWPFALLSIPFLILLHLRIAPYTKVEESFNIQATHDILTYGIPTKDVDKTLRANYDHFTFPGAVPRTFVGALVLAGVSRPFIWLNNHVNRQLLVRAVLGLFNGFALVFYGFGIQRAFGARTALWYTMFQASQFHLIYYASRPLPNTFALGLTTIAYHYLLPDPRSPASSPKRHRLAFYLFSLTAVTFRSEIALLLACHTIYLSIRFPISIRTITLPAVTLGLLVGLALTVSIDTYFWQSPTPLWPELSAFLFNIFPQSGSAGASAWGTQPVHWYFTSALPRLLLNPAAPFLIIYLLAHSSLLPRALPQLIPPLLYISLYSILPHKETRFILPAIPPLTFSVALSASHLSLRRGPFYRLLTILLIFTSLATALLSHAILAPLSSLSYPGARALATLHAHAAHTNIPPKPASPTARPFFALEQKVHFDNLALQTGITRFLQQQPPFSPNPNPSLNSNSTSATSPSSTRNIHWTYDKTGSEGSEQKLRPEWWAQWDWIVMESGHHELKAMGSWEVVDKVRGFGGVRILRPGEGEGKTGTGEVIREMYGPWAGEMWDTVVEEGWVKEVVRTRVTRGWWAEARMEDRLTLLRRAKMATGLEGEAGAVHGGSGGVEGSRLGGDW